MSWSGIVLLMFLAVLTMVYPNVTAKGVFQFILGFYLLVGGVLLSSSIYNIKVASLSTISTTIQIVFLFLSGYGLPLGIWGIVLLRAGVSATSQPSECRSHAPN